MKYKKGEYRISNTESRMGILNAVSEINLRAEGKSLDRAAIRKRTKDPKLHSSAGSLDD